MAWMWIGMVELPEKYHKKFEDFMKFENEKLNRIMQSDLDYFRRSIPKKYKNLIVAKIDYKLW